jgi:hypothetical protein
MDHDDAPVSVVVFVDAVFQVAELEPGFRVWNLH